MREQLRKSVLIYRVSYFAVLVAQENLAIARAMSNLADEVYRLQLRQVQGGQAAAYEPLQLHVLAVQARSTVVQARNRYLSAWRQLAAAELRRGDRPGDRQRGSPAGRRRVPAGAR